MSTAPGRRTAELAPGVVKVRLSGATPATDALIKILAAAAGVEILTGPDGPYPNHRDAGARMYVTLRLPHPGTADVGRAAHSHQAIRRPAAPSRRHHPS